MEIRSLNGDLNTSQFLSVFQITISSMTLLFYYLAPLQNDTVVTSQCMQFTFRDKGAAWSACDWKRKEGRGKKSISPGTKYVTPVPVNYAKVINFGYSHISEPALELHSRAASSVGGNITAQSVQPQGEIPEEGRRKKSIVFSFSWQRC